MAYQPWTDEQIELLKKHHSDGCSYSQIADLICAATGASFTKNACIGKGGRLGLEPRRRGGGRPRIAANQDRSATQRVRQKKIAITPYVEVIPPNEPPHLGLDLLQTNDATCKYARGDENFTFCGQPSLEGKPYCDFHMRVCYRPPETRVRPPYTVGRAA